METGTTINLSNKFLSQKKYFTTLILLCIGYFIDFYDLTIFSAGYVNVFRDLFNIHNTVEIQKLYLEISSIYTVGIFCGAILFGVLGDKFGRTTMIRYSILIYSVAMIASIFASSIPVFAILRFISGVGLAAEFATSSVLINEVFSGKKVSFYNSILYFCGILGGMAATYLGGLSWQVMYLFGGVSGMLIYLFRKKLYESLVYLNLDKQVEKGQFLQVFNSWSKIIKFLRLLLLIIPFNFLIVVMFIFPRFMNLHADLAELTKELLFGFFIGNLISTVFSSYITNWFKGYRVFLIINLVGFAIFLPIYQYVNESFYFLYTICLGLLAGGLPTVWIQVVVRSYGVNIRNTASNTLFAVGRLSGILFNLLVANWIINLQKFNANIIIVVVILSLLVLLSIVFTKNNYNSNMDFVE